MILAVMLVLTTSDDPGRFANEVADTGDCVNLLQKELIVGRSIDFENYRMPAAETLIAQMPSLEAAASLSEAATPPASEAMHGQAASDGKPNTAVSVDSGGQAIDMPAAETLIALPKAAASLAKPATPPASEAMHGQVEPHGKSSEAVSLHRLTESSSLQSGSSTSGLVIAVLVPVLVFTILGLWYHFGEHDSSLRQSDMATSSDSSRRLTSKRNAPRYKASGWEPTPGAHESSFESSSGFDNRTTPSTADNMDLALSLPRGASSGSETIEAMGLPLVYKPLVLPHVRTRLALPIQPLLQSEYVVDVLGPSGKPVLEATGQPHTAGALNGAAGRGRCSSVRVVLRGAGSVLVEVSQDLKFTSGTGVLLGSLEPSSTARATTFRTSTGDTPFMVTGSSSFNPELQDYRIHSVEGRPDIEFARVTARPSGKLPVSHYEVTTRAGVDGVMVVACLLAMVSLT